jgi:DNA-binding Lrp family transcriptional regulator
MVEKAYVLIETEVGETKKVVEAIHELAGVVLVDSVTGPYDAIATIERATLDEIGDLVTTKLHLISGVSRTVICLAVKSS